jgi:hypothetical protein
VILALLIALSAEEQFLQLLRTYPDRPPAETFRRVEQLIEQGPFEERDRAEFWIASAALAQGDRAKARNWFGRLARDYPGSVWEERSWLGLGDAAAQERDYGTALGWYARSQSARDAAVRELGHISEGQARLLRARQRLAVACAGLALCIAAFFAASALRRGARPWPLPAETRVVLPVLGVLALLSLRIDPAPRNAVLQLCAGGALVSLLSGMRLAAVRPRGLPRALHVGLALAALVCVGFVALYRSDLIGMVQETFRAGPE